MPTDIVYWDTGEYDTGRDVISAITEPTPGGILVNWGGGDADILTGTNWVVSPYKKIKFRIGVSCSGCITGYSYWYDAGNDGAFSLMAGAALEGGSCVAGEWGTRKTKIYSITTAFGTKNLTLDYDAWSAAGGACGVISSSTIVSLNDYDSAGIKNVVNHTKTPSFFDARQFHKVTSNTGQISQRSTTTPPQVSLITAGCRIKITYSDNSIEYIPFEECPPWVKIRPDNECPEGSCRVECETHYCCYENSTGILKKIIPK